MLQRKTPLKRTAIKKRRKVDKRTPGEREYFSWLAEQPCAVSKASSIYCERSHIRRLKYGAGTGKKPSDWFAIPIMQILHQRLHQMGDKTWENQYGPQESFLWQTWLSYGLDKIPQEIRMLYYEQVGETVIKEEREARERTG